MLIVEPFIEPQTHGSNVPPLGIIFITTVQVDLQGLTLTSAALPSPPSDWLLGVSVSFCDNRYWVYCMMVETYRAGLLLLVGLSGSPRTSPDVYPS